VPPSEYDEDSSYGGGAVRRRSAASGRLALYLPAGGPLTGRSRIRVCRRRVLSLLEPPLESEVKDFL